MQIDTYTHTRIHTYTHTHTHIHTYTYTRTHIHTYTHKHTSILTHTYSASKEDLVSSTPVVKHTILLPPSAGYARSNEPLPTFG